MVLKLLFRKAEPKDPNADLNRILAAMGSSLEVAENRCSIRRNRMVKVFLNHVEFWENGIKWLGIQGVNCVEDRARLIICWNEECMCSHQIEAEFPAIQFPEARKMIEMGEEAYLVWFWKKLVEKKDKRFGAIIDLCAEDERTRRLMSFVQLRDFGFSRSIGKVNGVDLNDLPRIRITDDWEFEVRTAAMAKREYCGHSPREFIGKGSAAHAFQLLLQHLPECGPASYHDGSNCHCPAA